MIYAKITAEKVARYLLEVKAVKLNTAKPFTWASGLKSPVYCDNRITLSYPEIRSFITQELVKASLGNFKMIDVVAGVATAGIAQGVLVARDLDLPFAYVRSSSKDHGMGNRIEGVVKPEQNVLVIEDLVSTGKSSLDAVSALRERQSVVSGMLSVFTYGLSLADENFEKANCPLISLSDYDTLIKVALDSHYITKKDIKSLEKWRENPKIWSDKA